MNPRTAPLTSNYERDTIVIGGMELKDGTLRVPEKPGLGLDVDPVWLKGLRPA